MRVGLSTNAESNLLWFSTITATAPHLHAVELAVKLTSGRDLAFYTSTGRLIVCTGVVCISTIANQFYCIYAWLVEGGGYFIAKIACINPVDKIRLRDGNALLLFLWLVFRNNFVHCSTRDVLFESQAIFVAVVKLSLRY